MLLARARDLYFSVIEHLPNLLGALALLLAGLAAAWLLRFLVTRVVRFGLRRLRRVRAFAEHPAEERYQAVPQLTGRIVFWFVLLLSIAPSVEVLDIAAVSAIVSDFTGFLPRILAAALIVLVGLLFGDLANTGVHGAAARMGVGNPELAGRLVQILVWGVAIMIAINQLGIESTALLILLAVVFGSAFGASALAFGLGARTTVGNIIASHYVQKSYGIGNRIRIDGMAGRIVQFTRTHVHVKTNDGTAMIPAQRFSEQTTHLLQENE